MKLYQTNKQLMDEYEKLKTQMQSQQTSHEKELQTQQDQYEKRLVEQQRQIDRLECQVDKLETQLFEIAKQPTQTTQTTYHHTTTTQTQNNRNIAFINQLAPYDLTKEQITERIDQYFGLDTFQGGPDEISKLMALVILTDPETQKPKVTCTDLSRKTFRYVDLDQKVQVDPGFQKTHALIKTPLFQANLRVFTNELRCAEKHLDQWRKNSDFIENRSEFSDRLLKFV
jgi:hypothetical protein